MRESLGLNISHNFIRYAKIQNNGKVKLIITYLFFSYKYSFIFVKVFLSDNVVCFA